MNKTTRLYRLALKSWPYQSIDNIALVSVPTGKSKDKKPVMESKYMFSTALGKYEFMSIDEVTHLIDLAFEYGLGTELDKYELHTYAPSAPRRVKDNLKLSTICNRIGQKKVMEKLKGTS